MGVLTIRRAKLEDAAALSQIANGLSHFYMADAQLPVPTWLQQSFTEEGYRQRLAEPAFIHDVAVIDGHVAGFIATRNNDYLYNLFVAQAYHGQGIAKRLWQHVLQRWQQQAVQPATVSLRSSLFAVPVYSRFGFVKVGQVGEHEGVAFQPMALALKQSLTEERL
ncbi:GNAT family N-acetyltransferase [Motilimonas pumila]|uniref:GNAT family N-acetyltransferase n=1 Tax=Motilimonas pumila TaxID=2303987 RepID=A0A418YEM8_9GAMM|nr:GNAT family N-acetyltransferase [Motilimonas pumila]RJG47561.1 GNAT family N-acetyltransferase [Motilimonas pumila]